MVHHRFSRDLRLTDAAQYRAVFKQAVACSSEYFTLLAIENHCRHGRLGFAIARRRIPHAVKRNTIKRVARESFRQRGDELAGLDIVVIAKNAADNADKKRLRGTLDRQWQRLCKRVRRESVDG